MTRQSNSYVYTTPRHNRYLIFVSDSITEENLRTLFSASLRIWGGRYNPIIPVKDGVISEEWLAIARHYDPDFIYYHPDVDLEYIKSLHVFAPAEYQELRRDGRYHLPGVNVHSLLHDTIRGDSYFKGPLSVMQSSGFYNLEIPAKHFYSLNLGLADLFLGEDKYVMKYKQLNIDKSNFEKINRKIYETDPFFKSMLSAIYLNTNYYRSISTTSLDNFELVVYEEDNYFDDLLYFWNRQLYIEPNHYSLSQVVVSCSELDILLETSDFEALLAALDKKWKTKVTSLTLNLSKLKEIRDKVQSKCKSVSISHYAISDFPFKVDNCYSTKLINFKASKNVILGQKGYLKFPELNLNTNFKSFDGSYVIDLAIEREGESQKRMIKFPYYTSLFHLVCRTDCRINKDHNVSVFVDQEQIGIEIRIPSDADIFQSLLAYRSIQKEHIKMPLERSYLSAAGQKLSALVRLFDNDWANVASFLEEKFWIDIFRSHSDLGKNSITSGKGTFSFRDVFDERKGLYKKHSYVLQKGRLPEEGDMKEDPALAERNLERYLEDDNEYHLTRDLQYLVETNGLFIGMKVKCHHCGSKKWYSLEELNAKIACKGCYNEAIPHIESPLYYRVSDVIRNNLVSDYSSDKNEFDGNYFVLRALISLRNDHKWCRSSFIWSPPMEIRIAGKHPRTTDIDILALQDGKLIMGEVKARAGLFTKKDIDNLIWIGKNLLPDVIILAYQSGRLGEQIQKIKNAIGRPECEVIDFKIGNSYYKFGGLFGIDGSMEIQE